MTSISFNQINTIRPDDNKIDTAEAEAFVRGLEETGELNPTQRTEIQDFLESNVDKINSGEISKGAAAYLLRAAQGNTGVSTSGATRGQSTGLSREDSYGLGRALGVTSTSVTAEIARLDNELSDEQFGLTMGQAVLNAGANGFLQSYQRTTTQTILARALRNDSLGYGDRKSTKDGMKVLNRAIRSEPDAVLEFVRNDPHLTVQERAFVLHKLGMGRDEIVSFLNEQQQTFRGEVRDRATQLWNNLGMEGEMPAIRFLGSGDGTLTNGIPGARNSRDGIGLFNYDFSSTSPVQFRFGDSPSTTGVTGMNSSSVSYDVTSSTQVVSADVYGLNHKGGDLEISLGEGDSQFSITINKTHPTNPAGLTVSENLHRTSADGETPLILAPRDGSSHPTFEVNPEVGTITIQQGDNPVPVNVDLASRNSSSNGRGDWDEMASSIALYGVSDPDIEITVKEQAPSESVDLDGNFPSGKFRLEDMSPEQRAAFMAQMETAATQLQDFIAEHGSEGKVSITIFGNESRVPMTPATLSTVRAFLNENGVQPTSDMAMLATARSIVANGIIRGLLEDAGVELGPDVEINWASGEITGPSYTRGTDDPHDAKFTEHQFLRASATVIPDPTKSVNIRLVEDN